ncbi:phage holin family protein [Klenkia terrae]|uniref:Phage holin family protein n=1 Tax=Klenkia terrae TaxID=1052259 RepID=A0ABU8E0P7_9ACTN|nr:phage holin family protein [Klenkia terrae]
MADPIGSAPPTTDQPTDPSPDRQETPVNPTGEHATTEHPTTEFGTDHPRGAQATAVAPPLVGPTGYATWQEAQAQPDPVARPGRRSPDVVALVSGALFVLVAVLALVGTSLPGWVFGGGLVATVLVVLGAGLLVSELRRIKR